MSSSTEPAGFFRKVFAVLCCAAGLAAYVAVAGVFLYYFHRSITDWVDRQDGLVNVVCRITVGLGYLLILGGAIAMVEAIWKGLTRPESTAAEPTADEPDDVPRCPRCGFRDLWDGVRCGHCGHSGRPWDRGARPGG